MRKLLLLAGIIAWVLVLVIVVALTVVNLRGGEWQGSGNALLQKEQQLDIDDGMRLVVRTGDMDIELYAGEGEQLCIRQYGADGSRLFTVNTNANGITIEARQKLRIGLHFLRDERLEVEIPVSWLGYMTAEVSSGRLRVNDAFTWQDVTLSSSSGSIVVEQPLTAANLLMDSNSGSIRVLAAVNIDGKCSISASSGSIHVDKTLTAQNFYANSNSGTIRLAETMVEQFELSSSSGSIRAAGLSGGGRCRANSGSIDVNLLEPLGDISLRASTGRINVTVPQELSFSFSGRCSSGSIRTDFPVDKHDNGKQVSGSVGANPTVAIEAAANSGSIDISRD